MASSDGWGKQFDDPIVLPGGKKLLRLPRCVKKSYGECKPAKKLP
jgi:hypothetical protein